MVKRVLFGPGGLEISKPGFDVTTTANANKHMSATGRPASIIQSGRLSIATNASVVVPWAFTLSVRPIIEIQVGIEAGRTRLPWWNRDGANLDIDVTVTTSGMTIINHAPARRWVNYIAVTEVL